MGHDRQIIVAIDGADQARQAAAIMADRARQAIAATGRFTVALSGGSTVRPIYEQFAASAGFDWSRVFLFWGDDRVVEQTNPYSNYGLAREALIERAPIPAANIFAAPVGDNSPKAAASKYSKTISEFFGLGAGESPRFDLIQLGMGPDGHTASLFPHSAALTKRGIVVMNHAGLSPWVDRVTFTFDTINTAACVLFVAKGAEKAETLRHVLHGERNVKHWPAGVVSPTNGELIWLLEPGIAAGS